MLKEREEIRPLLIALKDQLPALVQDVNDPSPEVRILARSTLEALGNIRDRLLRKQEKVQRVVPEGDKPPGKNPEGRRVRRQQILLAVADAPPVKLPDDVLQDGFQRSRAVAALAAGLMDRDRRARLAAVHALEMLGRDGSAAAPALVRSLCDPDPFVRWAAARTLGKMAPADADSAVPALARLLTDNDLDLRLAAATALEQYGPEARAAVPDLARAVGAGDAEIRVAALRALEGIGTDAQPALPAIIQALRNPDERVRQNAAEVLGHFGPLAAEAVPALRQALYDSDPNVRRAASVALLNIIPPPATK
jgi:HEAT repeat protein